MKIFSVGFSVWALASLVAVTSIPTANSATINAASCSLSDVQAAVSTAGDGDVVVLPNGNCAWSGGIATSKQIRVEAQSTASVKGGSMSRSVTITNNSTSVPLFAFTSGNSYHVGLTGIRFNEGNGSQNHVRISGTGSKVPLLKDCAFEVKNRFGSQPDTAALAILSQGAVIWNAYFNAVGSGVGGQCCPEGASILVNSPRAWNSASTMGSRDTSGTVNVYFEDSTLANIGQAPDVDDNGRFVMRYSVLDGAWGITHGFTSQWGARHFEYYNNTFRVTNANRNMAGRYFWIRAGTGVFTDNVVNSATNTQEWGNPDLFQIGDNTSPSSYPQSRQPGWGHDGTRDVIDPIYAWNNTGARASSWSYQGQPGGWQNTVVLNREIFVNSGAKPGWSKYAYPHPLRAAIETDVARPMPPSDVSVTQ